MLFGTVLLFSYLFTFPDGRLHIVFCDVGQGDAAYIRTPSNLDMLIDGGPNDQVLVCLGKNMPFYDRTIDIVVLSHPQKDHMQGLLSVLQRYQVRNFIIGAVGNDTEGYGQLVSLIKEKNIPVRNLYAGDSFSLGDVKFQVLWPEKEWVASQTLDIETGDASQMPYWHATAIAGSTNKVASGRTRKLLSEGVVLGLSTDADLNKFSYYLHLQYQDFDALFTGDGDSKIQPQILRRVDLPDVDVLKFPHHGSKYGVLPEFLDQIRPETAVISVGKNPWGHPTDEALKLLSEKEIKIRRTDREGEVTIISDGKD